MSGAITFHTIFSINLTIYNKGCGAMQCPRCGSCRVKYMKCHSSVRCPLCGFSSLKISAYINQGMTQKQACIAAWDDAVNKYQQEHPQTSGM